MILHCHFCGQLILLWLVLCFWKIASSWFAPRFIKRLYVKSQFLELLNEILGFDYISGFTFEFCSITGCKSRSKIISIFIESIDNGIFLLLGCRTRIEYFKELIVVTEECEEHIFRWTLPWLRSYFDLAKSFCCLNFVWWSFIHFWFLESYDIFLVVIHDF